MKMDSLEKVCLRCHQKNDAAALICVNCGADLEGGIPTNVVSPPEKIDKESVEKKANSLADYMGSVIDLTAIPEGGLGIRVAGELKPMYVHIEKELLIGRRTETSQDALLDLTILNAVNLGVSRRHALIKRTATGFEVTDLSSRNGTWLNTERLIPHKPYPLESGSLIRLGHLQLLIMYQPVRKKSTT
jgi:hypothetical protein